MYTDILLKRFKNPAHAGVIENADGVGEVGNPACGDILKVYVKIKNEVITDIKFETLGCAAAIAASDMLCELAKGKKIAQALRITRDDIAKALGGMPIQKYHCSLLAVDALKKAVENWKEKQK